MWDFTPFGLMMPAAVPMDKADAKFTEGKFDLQVRGRVDSHLRYMMDNYMEPGSFHDEIEYTPGMDYNVRFYTTREGYADAMRLIILDIDYKKFKPTAERKDAAGVLLYKGARDYHMVLNAIWGNVTRLGSPGGVWGSYDKKVNPTGFKPYGGGRGTLKRFTERFSNRWSAADDSIYGTRSSVTGRTYAEALDLEYYDEPEWASSDLDWTPSKENQRTDLLAEVRDIPVNQWEDYLTEEEFKLIEGEYNFRMSEPDVVEEKPARKRNRSSKRYTVQRGRKTARRH